MRTENQAVENSIFVIAPYWFAGTWVFDDPARGLAREPFVAGVPEIITRLTSAIPDARNGFRLVFSASPFPGAQEEYRRVRSESGGTWYETADGEQGWLCLALRKYFAVPPERLFARAEPLS